MHGLTPRLHGSPTCLPGPSLLYCDHGPRSPSSLSAAVTSGTGRAALFLPSNALVSRVSPRCGYDMPQQRRRRCRAPQGMKKGRRPRRRPRLKLSDRAGPDQCPVPGENALFPAQIAGFLAVSRPVPVYPVFLNYVVPVQSPLGADRVHNPLQIGLCTLLIKIFTCSAVHCCGRSLQTIRYIPSVRQRNPHPAFGKGCDCGS